jgi:hypothetical protein
MPYPAPDALSRGVSRLDPPVAAERLRDFGGLHGDDLRPGKPLGQQPSLDK